jgi:hypothetical protein
MAQGDATPLAAGPVAVRALVIALGATAAAVQARLASAGPWDALLYGGITGVHALGLPGAAAVHAADDPMTR